MIDSTGPDGSLGPLDPTTRVLEFESLGTKVRNTKRFYVVNPTNVPYEFVWASETELQGGAEVLGHRPFRCNTRKGMVLPGRKFEMVFDFTPESTHLEESFWRFRIPSLQIDVPFLLVGAIVEPNVKLDRTRHSFGPKLLGQKARAGPAPSPSPRTLPARYEGRTRQFTVEHKLIITSVA